MNHKKKKPCGNMAKFKTVHLVREQVNNSTTKPATKGEACIQAFLKYGSLNTFEANRAYNDTCLHSCVSFLSLRYGLEFSRQFENIGARQPVKRYTPKDINEMKRVLNNMWIARGVGVKK
jgi:hypothetical protein